MQNSRCAGFNLLGTYIQLQCNNKFIINYNYYCVSSGQKLTIKRALKDNNFPNQQKVLQFLLAQSINFKSKFLSTPQVNLLCVRSVEKIANACGFNVIQITFVKIYLHSLA